MSFNPVLKKEIISTSRSMKLPIFIFIVNVICAIAFLCAIIAIDNSYLDVGTSIEDSMMPYYKMINARTILNVYEAGENIRIVIGFFLALEFAVIYLVIPSYCASSIAEERQQQTYETLITTGYSRKKIIIGKMTGGMVVMFTYVASSLPFLIGMLGMYSVSIKRLFVIIAGMIINGYFCAGVGAFAGSKAKNTRSSNVLGIAWVMAITFFTIAIPAAFYGIKSVIYNYDYYFGDKDELIGVSVGPIKYLTLFNPLISVCSLIMKAIGVNYSVKDLAEEFGGSLRVCSAVEEYWTIISLLLLACMGTLFFYLASVRINPLKGLCRYKKKISPQKNGTISDDIL